MSVRRTWSFLFVNCEIDVKRTDGKSTYDVNDRRHVIEAMNPLPPLGALSTNVNEHKVRVVDGEVELADPRGLGPSADHVLVRRDKVVLGKAQGVLEIAKKRIGKK